MRTIDTLLRKRLIICVGSGGVGKTTTAAALALAAALHARRCAVITVDPARRLKDALGLDGLSIEPQHVTIELTVTPPILPGRPVALFVGAQSFAGPAITEPTSNLTFSDLDMPAGLAATHLVVDGIESPWIDRDATPPVILPAAFVNVP